MTKRTHGEIEAQEPCRRAPKARQERGTRENPATLPRLWVLWDHRWAGRLD